MTINSKRWRKEIENPVRLVDGITKNVEECVLAPHFPSDDPDKFAFVQKVFGTNYILKLLQGLKSELRASAVKNMVYEASVRVKDPTNGTASIVNEQMEKIGKLES
ncbi:hypothetical protein SUGI_0879670 [Cryptomeria japonica]|nr:hypothetical protein SUGI_0879670 [Cryptomeria japonica]